MFILESFLKNPTDEPYRNIRTIIKQILEEPCANYKQNGTIPIIKFSIDIKVFSMSVCGFFIQECENSL